MEVDEAHISLLPLQPLPIVHVPASYDDHRGKHTPLCIDNGSSNLRFGFCTSNTPRSGINTIAKYKERGQTSRIDIEGGARSQAKSAWEGDVLLNFDALENALDYAFIHLGIDTPMVDHPILMTERLSSPLHSRARTILRPLVAFCVDSVMSFYHNNIPSPPVPFHGDGLVVSFNTASTSVIPILHGKGLMSHAKRINWGASQRPSTCSSSSSSSTPRSPTKSPTPTATYVPVHAPVTEEKTEEELARIAERRREQGRKLQELAAKSRMEKVPSPKRADLAHLVSVRERKDEETKREWAETLKEEGFSNDAALDGTIKKLEADLKKARRKDADGEEPEDEPPSFPLVDVPDDELDEDSLKEKKKQKLMKAGHEARERAKREKEREREEIAAAEKREGEERDRDLSGWSAKLRREQESLMTRIKDRNRRKAALLDRKSAAAQARMKNIANLRRTTGCRRRGGRQRAVNQQRRASSDEEDDLANLAAVEQKLLQHDPTFTEDHTHAALTSQQSALMEAFRPRYDDGDVQGKSRIHLSVERWRVPEAWFSPSMAGVDSAGLGEVLQNVLARFPEQDKGRLVRNVFLTGGPSQLPGLSDRLRATLRPILPPEMPLEIVQAADPVLDAWRGMADFARTEEFKGVGVTRAEYDEWGGERVKRWWGGNWNSSVAM
ncbi:actin-like ATPase domain-containing protein [Epithele typhae]|uniref:actin-like ATPase domain-containing protein n=1 Tax=Epithele typhae TaxID=378194 RepID=UPI002008B9B1|nr:actin-like ATPase domain-containing protein [Epithele typhae]KAH9913148.1 actin-like ATPase domain-containing protein [Epithele typhae]